MIANEMLQSGAIDHVVGKAFWEASAALKMSSLKKVPVLEDMHDDE